MQNVLPNTTKYNRRAFLSAGAVAITGAGAGATLAAGEESPAYVQGYHDAIREVPEFRDKLTAKRAADPHVEWLAEWKQAKADWITAAAKDQTGNSNSAECMDAQDREYAVADLIIGTEARTDAGLKAQMELLIRDQWDNLVGEYGERFAQFVVNGLKEVTV